jgi:GT2 family glycosyltransferase
MAESEPTLSVMIPTHGRPAALERCLGGLARQDAGAGSHEILVGFDGPDPAGEAAASRTWLTLGGDPERLRIVAFPRCGYIAVRNRLLPMLRGRFVLSLNDDVVPEPSFLAAHRRAHEQLAAAGRSAVIVGDSRFTRPEEPTLLDEALDRTGMVFFWHAMDASDPGHDWGFRHCFGLNVSMPRSELLAAGGMPAVADAYGYDDIEFGWRLARRGLPVLHRPEARAPHEHRYRAAVLLQREWRLGVAAVRWARINPAFTRELFGRDILDPAERDFARAFLQRERGDLLRRRERFLELDHVPASGFDSAMLPLACELVADHARPLRRACWFEGLLAECGEPVADGDAITPAAAAAPRPAAVRGAATAANAAVAAPTPA